MNFSFSSASVESVKASWLVVFHFEESDGLSSVMTSIDEQLGGSLTRVIERGDLTGKLAELVVIPDAANLAVDRVVVVGLGNESKLKKSSFRKALSTAIRKISDKQGQKLAIEVPASVQKLFDVSGTLEMMAETICVACTPQNLYQKEPSRFPFESIEFVGLLNTPEHKGAIRRGEILAEAINLTRELVNRHPDDIYPDSFATRAVEELADLDVHGEILGQHLIEQERMGALLAVAKGSDREPRVVLLRYDGGDKSSPTIGLVGKGVTFDSGGLSIKPTAGMLSMKADMAGAATVLGIVRAVARLKLPVNLIAVVGLVENMTGGSAYKMGDVLTTRNGTTVEIHNTDAEGRLVLADILDYAVEQGADRLIDFATLTGSCVVALGEDIVGAFPNDQKWCDQVVEATRESGEEIWQMPMNDFFADQLKSDFADCKNVGTRWGGAITAAKFLEKFVAGRPWVHLDIAGPSYAESGSAGRDSGGTGVMVRSIVQLMKKDLT